MKTRSEWGSWEEFSSMAPYSNHKERRVSEVCTGGDIFCAEIDGFEEGFAPTREEARRIATENFCKDNHASLPWRPDFDLSTIAGCKEAIKSCGYSVNMPGLSGTITLIQIEDTLRSKNVNVIPGLESWQQAAQFAIDNHEH